MKRIAVITDATSPEYLFPVWIDYYGGLFGRENLFVVTYDGIKSLFPVDLGFVWDMNTPYSDDIRAKVLSSLCSSLLDVYHAVIRCDVDEFLVADPRKYATLRNFVTSSDVPYITARGIDVIETSDELEFKTDTGLLAQRQFGVRSAALNKTCVIQSPVRWAPGFHGADVFPKFDRLFLFHMKFADIKGRIKWFDHMSSLGFAADSREATYFSQGAQKLSEHQKWLLKKPVVHGWPEIDDKSFDTRFIESVTYNQIHRIYQGAFTTGDSVFRIPDDFRGIV